MSWFDIHRRQAVKTAKDMPVPFGERDKRPINQDKIKGRKGSDFIDVIMHDVTREDEENAFPDMKYLNQGNRGIVYDLGNGKVLKYVFERNEYETALYIQQNPIPCAVRIFDVQMVQKGDGNVYRIISEKLLPLKRKKDIDIINKLRDFIKPIITQKGLGGFKSIPSNIRNGVAADYLDMCHCLVSRGYSISDAHGENVGYNSEGNLVLMDLGYSNNMNALPGQDTATDDFGRAQNIMRGR